MTGPTGADQPQRRLDIDDPVWDRILADQRKLYAEQRDEPVDEHHPDSPPPGR